MKPSEIPLNTWVIIKHNRQDDIIPILRLSETEFVEETDGGYITGTRATNYFSTLNADFIVLDWFEEPITSVTVNTDECSTNARCSCVNCTEYDKLYGT